MNTSELKELSTFELQSINGGLGPLAALAACAGIYAAAHVAAYYKGYSDANDETEPCTESSSEPKYVST